MNLLAIAIMIAVTLGAWLFRRHRLDALLVISILALYLLQSGSAGSLDLALPTGTILLVIGVWWLTSSPRPEGEGAGVRVGEYNWRTLLLIGCTAIIVPAASLAFGMAWDHLLRGVPLVFALLGSVVTLGALVPTDDDAARRRLAVAFVGLIIILFVVIKVPALQAAISDSLPRAADQPFRLTWQWLGFSYIAFRLMHVLLDYRSGKLKPVSLRDFALYVVFYPALPAGPIDRVEHFARELQESRPLTNELIVDGGTRIGIGLFKKFVVADSLALLALRPQLVADMTGPYATIATWVMIYAYAFQIYFDFSGYTDVAIGIAQLAGITLPENFRAPYLHRNIAAFWNNWHITLSTWFRNYFFTPFSRVLMGTSLRTRRMLMIFVGQVSTMVLIGLWHGVAFNFVLWGLWHGVGLWFHRWLTEHTRAWDARVQASPRLSRALHVLSVLATFHFVAIGWIFFALTDLRLIGKALAGLVGIHLS